MASIGTAWTAPLYGARVDELREAIAQLVRAGRDEALDHLGTMPDEHRTNIILNGAPLSSYDLKRIAVCD